MNGTDVELRKELWMWRGVAILLLFTLLITQVITFAVDRRTHAKDNVDRAQTWTMLLERLDRNRDEIRVVNENLKQCSNCHTHPQVPDNVTK